MPSTDAVAAIARMSHTPAPELGTVARDFEALVFQQLLKQAAKPLGKGGALDRGPGARLYREMLFQELAGVAGRAGSLGLAELLEKQALKEGDADGGGR